MITDQSKATKTQSLYQDMYIAQFQQEVQRLNQDSPPDLKLGGVTYKMSDCQTFIDNTILTHFRQLITNSNINGLLQNVNGGKVSPALQLNQFPILNQIDTIQSDYGKLLFGSPGGAQESLFLQYLQSQQAQLLDPIYTNKFLVLKALCSLVRQYYMFSQSISLDHILAIGESIFRNEQNLDFTDRRPQNVPDLTACPSVNDWNYKRINWVAWNSCAMMQTSTLHDKESDKINKSGYDYLRKATLAKYTQEALKAEVYDLCILIRDIAALELQELHNLQNNISFTRSLVVDGLNIYWGIYLPSQVYFIDVWGYKRFAVQYIIDTGSIQAKFGKNQWHLNDQNKTKLNANQQVDFQRYLKNLVLLNVAQSDAYRKLTIPIKLNSYNNINYPYKQDQYPFHNCSGELTVRQNGVYEIQSITCSVFILITSKNTRGSAMYNNQYLDSQQWAKGSQIMKPVYNRLDCSSSILHNNLIELIQLANIKDIHSLAQHKRNVMKRFVSDKVHVYGNLSSDIQISDVQMEELDISKLNKWAFGNEYLVQYALYHPVAFKQIPTACFAGVGPVSNETELQAAIQTITSKLFTETFKYEAFTILELILTDEKFYKINKNVEIINKLTGTHFNPKARTDKIVIQLDKDNLIYVSNASPSITVQVEIAKYSSNIELDNNYEGFLVKYYSDNLRRNNYWRV